MRGQRIRRARQGWGSRTGYGRFAASVADVCHYRALYRRASRLYQELALAHADGTYVRLLAKLARAEALAIDDFAMAALPTDRRHDLLEILEDRYGRRSTIIASQLDTKRYLEYLGDPTVADAVCDRLLHNAHRIVLKDPSRRKQEASAK